MIYLPILLTVVSSAAYHFTLKQASSKSSPFAVLFWSYLIAAVVCLVAVIVTNGQVRITADLKEKSYLPALLAVALVGIEVGYLMSYKNGGNVGQVSMIAQMLSIIVLLIVGFFLMKEPLTLQKGLGVITALFSFLLLSRH